MGQRVGNLHAIPCRRFDRQSASGDQGPQWPPLDVLHDNVGLPLGLAYIINGADVRVIQPGKRQRLFAKTLPGRLVSQEAGRQDFQGYIPIQLLVPGPIDHAHAAFALTALLASHHLQVWHMMAVVLVAGVAQAFGGPAYMALIPGLVKRQDLPNAIALNSIQFNLARGIGPLLAGAALATVGATLCFALNGVSFIAVIVSLYMIRASFVPARTDDSVLAGMRDGFAYVKQRGPLWHLSMLGFAAAFCGVPLLTLLPVFARDVFHIGAAGYSRMMAMSGAGAIVGALLYAGLSHRKGHGRMALRVQIVFALLLAVFAVSKNLWLSYAALFLGGICLIAVFASITSMVQMATSEEMRGRVMSIFMLAFRSGMPLGNLAIATLAARLSPSIALLVGAVLMCSTALAFLFSSSGVKKM